jgi:rod shape determining protein RodA
MPLIELLPVLLIFIFGLINLLGIRQDLMLTHLFFFGVGGILFLAIKLLKIKAQFFRRNALFFYIFFLILLIVTYFIGVEVKGSRRWVDFYIFRFQPSEFFKLVFIIFLAQVFSTYNALRQKRTIFLSTLFATSIPFLFIYKQPDLGTAMVIFAIFFVMSLLSPTPKKQMLYFLILVVTLLPLLWVTLHDYQRDRILTFMNVSEASQETTYNINQAIIAVGSGHLMGTGLGMGKQSQLYFLPEYHTDFAFSSFIEQFGFIGGFVVIVLYLSFFYLLFRRMLYYMNHKDELGRFNYYYLVGFSAFMIFQTSVNIGMNMGILPIAGITLPFISYGGSSLITLMIGLALLP